MKLTIPILAIIVLFSSRTGVTRIHLGSLPTTCKLESADNWLNVSGTLERKAHSSGHLIIGVTLKDKVLGPGQVLRVDPLFKIELGQPPLGGWDADLAGYSPQEQVVAGGTTTELRGSSFYPSGWVLPYPPQTHVRSPGVLRWWVQFCRPGWVGKTVYVQMVMEPSVGVFRVSDTWRVTL